MGKINKIDLQPGFKFTLRQFGDIGHFTVLTEDEILAALDREFLNFIKREYNFRACRDSKSGLTRAIHVDIICDEGIANS